jgi:hypothetical protein
MGRNCFSKMSTDVTYQEILAGFVYGVKDLGAQWYSIKPLQNVIPSLVDLLEVSAENLQSLLVKGGLGKFGKVNKLSNFHASKI